jgi:hypothetical protein
MGRAALRRRHLFRPPETTATSEGPDTDQASGDTGDGGTTPTPATGVPVAGHVATPSGQVPAAGRGYVVGDPGRAAGQVRPLPDLRFPERPDTEVDGYTIAGPEGRPGVEVRKAGVRGLAHRYYGTVRQDSAAVRVSSDGQWLVAAVADGVSAGAHSHIAADAATAGAADDLVAVLAATRPEAIDWPAMFSRLADHVVRAVHAHLAAHGVDPGGDLTDLASRAAATVLIAVLAVAPELDDSRELHLIGLGDTSAWTGEGTGWRCVYGGKTEDVLACSATAALPLMPAQPPHPVRTRLGCGRVLALVTDGIGDPLGDGTGEVGAFFAEHWQAPPAPLEFAAQIDFARRSYDDDRTAVVIWPQETP